MLLAPHCVGMSSLDGLYDLMRVQHGMIHVRQARSLGVTRHQIATRLANGALVVVQPGVVTPAGVDPSPRALVHASYLAVQFGGTSASPRRVAVADCCAAASYGWLLPSHEPRPHLIVPVDVRAERVSARVRRVRDWDRRRFATVDGLVTTIPVDTLLDLAAIFDRDELFPLVQSALHRRPSDTARLVARCREGVAGSTHVREVVAALRVGVDSVLHRHGHRHLRVAGLPRPECGLELLPRTGPRDCVLRRPRATAPPWGMVVNWDGDIHRVSRRKQRHDRAVDRRLRRGGWASVRYGWEDHEEPADMYDDLTTTWGLVLDGPRSWL